MKIGIIGAGAIGLFYAYQFSSAFPVTLYVRRDDQKKQIQQNPITLIDLDGNTKERTVSVKLFEEVDECNEDVIIVAVKQYAISDIIPSLMELKEKQTVIFLQNGMGHLEWLNTISDARIILGIVEHGVKKINDYTIRLTGKGQTKVSDFHPANFPSYFLEQWEKHLAEEFPFVHCSDYKEMLIEKLVVNAVVNPLTALYRVQNGVLLSNGSFTRTMRLLFDEISFIVSEDQKEEKWDHIVKICEQTAGNWSSMERDLHLGKETEIDAILGYIIFLAKEQGVRVPVTEFIYEAIKGLQLIKT